MCTTFYERRLYAFTSELVLDSCGRRTCLFWTADLAVPKGNSSPKGGLIAKARDTPKGSDLAYEEAVKIVREQIEFELETCRRLLGTDPQRVLELLAKPQLKGGDSISSRA